jgi:hypothetical protein
MAVQVHKDLAYGAGPSVKTRLLRYLQVPCARRPSTLHIVRTLEHQICLETDHACADGEILKS